MRLLTVTAALAALTLAAPTENIEIQDGVLYLGKHNNDGTTSYVAAHDSNARAVVVKRDWALTERSVTPAPVSTLETRAERAVCNGNTNKLNAGDTDYLTRTWREILSRADVKVKGHDFATLQYNDVRVYYCVNRQGHQGSLSLDDFKYALLRMDQHCPPYQSSYFSWDSPESVGKQFVSQPFCG